MHESHNEHAGIPAHQMVAGEASRKEYIKFGFVIAGILLLSWLLYSLLGIGGIEDFLRWFMGVFFVVFAGFKFIGYEMFTMMFPSYDLLAMRYKAYAYVYPFIELGLGIMYIADVVPVPRDLFTIAIMAIGGAGVQAERRKRRMFRCACLGNIIKLPLSTVSLAEDVGMGLMAVVMLLARVF